MTSRPDTSRCPRGNELHWPASWPSAPRIVAESLVSIVDPIRTGIAAGPEASGAEVARALARSLLPPEQPAVPPPWLLSGQARSFRRALAALSRYGGALVADPVGSGKTYVALAVAAASRPPATCLVPATLAAQWSAVAGRLGVAVEVGTHEQASRGRLPAATTGLVIIDECHHFRNPHARRYIHVAPWLVERPVVLLSATPIVNRLNDLVHQLLLGIRDDALLSDGVVSLRAALAAGVGVPALGRLVIEDTAEPGPRPARAAREQAASPDEDTAARELVASLERLRLSRHAATAALIRGVLVRAAASSPAALAGALRRYRGLLRHGDDARRAGRSLGRAELRQFAGELDDQLVLWELVAQGSDDVELALDDLEAIEGVMEQAKARAQGPDAKLERLGTLLSDGRPTIVFTTRRETVRHLRDRLGPPPVAWCTGDRAGLGPAPAPRAIVMRWFRDESGGGPAPARLPTCLVATDVAAEGLDLRRAERVVHYDLPWTPMRLEQREGRAVRLGSTHRLIEVVRFQPSAAIEEVIRQGERLARKAVLPGLAGLGPDGLRLWRWRSDLADRLGCEPGVPGTAVIQSSDHAGILAGYELIVRRGAGPDILGSAVGWLDADGRWTDDSAVVADRLLEAARCSDRGTLRPEGVRLALDRLATPIRARLAVAGGRRWMAGEPTPAARRLAERLGQGVADAARRRDRRGLEQLERALAFVGGGHTAGEEMLVARLADAGREELRAWTARGVPASTRRWEAIDVRLTGMILFER